MEKTFRRYLEQPQEREAFAEAEAATRLASQIRVLRTQRGWSQADLAARLHTTQGVVSRLEAPSYGRVSFRTLVALARVFDVAPIIGFASLLEVIRDRWTVAREELEVPAFAEQAQSVHFVEAANWTAARAMSVSTVLIASGGDSPQAFSPAVQVMRVDEPRRQGVKGV